MELPDGATIAVTRDGIGWVCEVEWTDGVRAVHELSFTLSGYPEILITSEDQALCALEEAVRRNPHQWR